MKKKVTVTIDEGIWEKFSELKWDKRKSVSEMVEELIRANLKIEFSGFTFDGGVRKPNVPEVSEVEKTEAPPPLPSDKKVAVISDLKTKLSEVKETSRERMKRLHPRDICQGCRNYNKDCTCP